MITFTPEEIETAIRKSYERNSFNEVYFWENLKKGSANNDLHNKK